MTKFNQESARIKRMDIQTLAQLEEQINRLSLDEQLWLIEKLAQRIRQNMAEQNTQDDLLAAMANDPEIQRELKLINEEFASVELDGLEDISSLEKGNKKAA